MINIKNILYLINNIDFFYKLLFNNDINEKLVPLGPLDP